VKDGCYLIHAASMSVEPPSATRGALRRFGHFAAAHYVSLIYRLPQSWRRTLWELAELDHFYHDGPYPMFFGGMMTKGQISRRCVRHLERDTRHAAENAELITAIRQQMAAGQS